MSWIKLDDHFPTHPKMIEAGGDAAWLHVCALCYCAEHLTDGAIPANLVGRLSDRKSPMKLAARLVELDVWIQYPDQYVIHDYLDWNPSREQVLTERQRAAERRATGGRASPNGSSTDINPVPVPVPVPDVLTEHSRRKRRSGPPPDFQPTDSHQAFALEQGLDLDRERAHWLAHCEAKGVKYERVNAGFTTWMHQAVGFGRGGKPVATLEELATPSFDRGPWVCRAGNPECVDGWVDTPAGAKSCECRA